MKKFLATAAVAAMAGAAFAAPVVDGTIAGDTYGAARAVQTVETGFGDNLSELNAAYGVIDGGRLHLALTGNIENNFNKLEIFIDSRAGGENTFSANPSHDNVSVMGGMKFDAGFDADYHVIARRGNFGGDKFDLNFAELGGGFSEYFDVFGGTQEGAGSTGTGVNASPIDIAYDNSNIAGVGGGSGAAANQADALAVQTGFEISIDLADLGYTGGDIRVSAFVNNGDHNYVSNQVLGGLPVGTGNLGGDGAGGFTGSAPIDWTTFAGDQYFIVPEPASLALLAMGLLALRRR